MNNLSTALQGYRIIEFGLNLPGPMLTQRLGRYGAITRKIEPPTGDPVAGMFRDCNGVPVLYQALNGEKQIERIDLKTEEGKRQVLRYVADADILVESSTPGVMEALGIDYETCRRVNPMLIYCSITGFGQTAVPGHDINFLAAAGYGAAMRFDALTKLVSFPVGDIAGGVLAAESKILASLLRRLEVKAGQRIQIDIVAQLRELDVMGAALRASQSAPGNEFLRGEYPCYRVYRCKDESLLAVGALEPKFWERFCKLTKLESLQNRQFEGVEQGDAHALVEQSLLARSATEWEAISLSSPCCLTAVL